MSAVDRRGCFLFVYVPITLTLKAKEQHITSHGAVCMGVVGVHCDTHRLALQGLWGDGLRRDAGSDGSSVRWVAVLWGRGMTRTLTEEGRSQVSFIHFSLDEFNPIHFK